MFIGYNPDKVGTQQSMIWRLKGDKTEEGGWYWSHTPHTLTHTLPYCQHQSRSQLPSFQLWQLKFTEQNGKNILYFRFVVNHKPEINQP